MDRQTPNFQVVLATVGLAQASPMYYTYAYVHVLHVRMQGVKGKAISSLLPSFFVLTTIARL